MAVVMVGTLFIFFTFCVCLSFANPIYVNPETRALQDDFGRERLFHGVNVIYKSMMERKDNKRKRKELGK